MPRQYAHPRLLANWEDWFHLCAWLGDGGFRSAPARSGRKCSAWPTASIPVDARMTLGTDMGNPWIAPGISLHREMQLLADAGVPNGRILAAATVNARRCPGCWSTSGPHRTGLRSRPSWCSTGIRWPTSPIPGQFMPWFSKATICPPKPLPKHHEQLRTPRSEQEPNNRRPSRVVDRCRRRGPAR